MTRDRRGARSSGRRSPTPARLAWVGGRVVAPFYITEGTPYRPEMILWLELPQLSVVFYSLSNPGEAPVSFGATLLDAMKSPLIGPPRTPGTVRVAEERLAKEVRQALPGIRTVVAPTPEVQEVLELMTEATSEGAGHEEPSYLEQGRIGIEAVEALFRAAKLLYHVAPWKVADDNRVLCVDIPAYGMKGACLSIIGAIGESIGFILFPSIEGFERFVAAADLPRPPRGVIDLGGTTLSLNFEAGSDLPPNMLREALEHGWPVADVRGYPMVQHRDRDALLRPLIEHDVRVVTACSTSLVAFFVKHRRLFQRDAFAPVCESYFDNDDLEVRFTMPYEARGMFEVNTASHPTKGTPGRMPHGGRGGPNAAAVGRNQPCPCGSGKKYKLCCQRRQESSVRDGRGQGIPPDVHGVPAVSHDLDRRVVARMDLYARGRFGPRWMEAAARAFRDRTMTEALMGPWAFHHHPFEGKPIAQWILDDQGVELQETDRAWLNAQRAAWLSVWEVLDVDPGKGLTLRDLLTDETRVVREVAASRMLGRRDAVLARVVDHQGQSVLCGVYPRSLPPRDAAVVVARVHGRLRRKRSIPAERMRGEAIGRYLIARWEEALEDANLRASRPPVLQNTDGDPLLLTVDHFAFKPADRTEIQRRLAAGKEVEDPPEADDPEPVYLFTKPGNEMHRGWESTIIGRVTISGSTLRAESNSIQRADSMRHLLYASLGLLIHHRGREHADPVASMREDAPAAGGSSVPPSSDEIDQVILEMKTKHYADWADYPMPALEGMTPRAAARTKSGRQMVDLLLRENEHLEARAPAGQRFDFSAIRRELGLKG